MNSLIWIAWGSGSWKSTIARKIRNTYSDTVSLIHLDDYHERKRAPIKNWITLWDHPDAINFDLLYQDLTELIHGKNVNTKTRDQEINPNFKEIWKIPHTILAKKVILLEWYKALYSEKIRNLFIMSFYLDIPIEESLKRRRMTSSSIDWKKYFSEVVIPMHRKYVLPTKKRATKIIDVQTNNIEQTYTIIQEQLKNTLSTNLLPW